MCWCCMGIDRTMSTAFVSCVHVIACDVGCGVYHSVVRTPLRYQIGSHCPDIHRR